MSYKIVFKESVKKELKRLPTKTQDRILDKIESLADDPKQYGVIKMTEFDLPSLPFNDYYRVRVGDYRIVYAIEDKIITITIVKIAHRKEVYE